MRHWCDKDVVLQLVVVVMLSLIAQNAEVFLRRWRKNGGNMEKCMVEK